MVLKSQNQLGRTYDFHTFLLAITMQIILSIRYSPNIFVDLLNLAKINTQITTLAI